MCIICQIINKELPSKVVYENEDVICFHDIAPEAPVHILLAPKKHYADILEMSSSRDGKKDMGAVLDAVKEIASLLPLEEGFRIINNCRELGGQTIFHVHFHILGGVAETTKNNC